MKGKCLCGQVQFQLLGKMPNLYQCHCQLCRKQGGSLSNAATIVPIKKFSWVAGLETISQFKKDTGFSSDFCSHCGSPVPNKLRDSDLMWVPAGLLENDDELKIVAHIYTRSKAKWDNISSNDLQFDEMPSLEEFIKTLELQ